MCIKLDFLPCWFPFPFQAAYWSFWGVLFSALVTWALAVAAAAGDAWVVSDGFTEINFQTECEFSYDEFSKSCDLSECKSLD